ncbi:MAG: prepilin-type N-terminal cleavage/methylation domain-containing protein, partial [Verrucomicrobiae bacterium]|nr:prepilin-type N-terminal cleavage/methylation domain-containing protein [Verrucomicrobiae bacterium]
MKLNKKNPIAAGFSLVEMLVVIAVIGIIAAIAV